MSEWHTKFWTFVHDTAEKLWHWVYYNKIAPKRTPDDGVYFYRCTYKNSTSDADDQPCETYRNSEGS